MVAAIAAIIVGVVFGFGHMVQEQFERTSNCLMNQGDGAPYPDCPGDGQGVQPPP